LTKIGYEVGLISEERYRWVCEKEELIEKEIARLNEVTIGARTDVQELLTKHNSTPLKTATTLAELIRRPELVYEDLAPIDPDRPNLHPEVIEQVNILVKYDGYISRQYKQVADFKKLENKKLPQDFDYKQIPSLRTEAVQKLNQLQPVSIGQASRISGVSPADISVMLVFFKQYYRNSTKEK